MHSDKPLIIGIDPGSTVTGFAIVEGGEVPRARLIDCLKLPRADFPQRLGLIFDKLHEVIQAYQPDHMAIEDVFVSRNVASALKLGQARGAAICAGASAGLTVFEYTPTQIKQAIAGRGHAQKAQIQHMVRLLLAARGPLQEDAADAAAVALCHAHHAHTNSRMKDNARGSRA